VTFTELLYSTADDKETVVKLKKQKKVARIANRVANHWLERFNVADQFPDHKTEMQVKIQLAYDGEDEHRAQQDFMDKLAGLGARKVQIMMGAADPDGIGVN
jgi:biopolymer transport protein ExbD